MFADEISGGSTTSRARLWLNPRELSGPVGWRRIKNLENIRSNYSQEIIKNIGVLQGLLLIRNKGVKNCAMFSKDLKCAAGLDTKQNFRICPVNIFLKIMLLRAN